MMRNILELICTRIRGVQKEVDDCTYESDFECSSSRHMLET